MHMLVLIDGLSPQAAMRTGIDCAAVGELITATTERILGLDEDVLGRGARGLRLVIRRAAPPGDPGPAPDGRA
ncbi:hypothetical protein [Streptomyces sp. NPDC058247]|uniref:hypothetical protein n=1 Tax=Streptomyces sp. NPDC058247 TaxID=3346401 RepID=UPI0036E1CB35